MDDRPPNDSPVLFNPMWRVDLALSAVDQIEELPILSIKHPTHGWLCFQLPIAEAQSIASWLTRPHHEFDLIPARPKK